MKLIVNPHKIELVQEEAVNEKEIDISKCEFEFADEITEDYVKEAYFTLGDNTYKKVIVNDECTFPQEVLVRPATIELGVVAYLVEDETEIKRYNPTPVYFKTDLGSLKQAQNSQPITPSEFEQYEQALQDGLETVNDKLVDINTAITETNNLDLDANKSGTTTTVTLTKKDGTSKQVQILDGEKGETGDRGPQGIQGPAGQTGPAGRDGTDGVSPTATVTKSGSTATITITDKNGTTTTTVSDGTNGTNGTNGRDGVIQYTAGDNITIENNVISATGGGDLSNYYTKSETNAITGLLTNLSTTSKTDLVSAINEVFGMAGVPKLTSSTVSVASLNAGVYILDGVTKITNSGATYNISQPSILMVVDYSANTKGAFVFTRIGGITYMSHTTTTSISLFNVADKNYVDTAISNKIWIGTQIEYDNLGTYSNDTVYFIKES